MTTLLASIYIAALLWVVGFMLWGHLLAKRYRSLRAARKRAAELADCETLLIINTAMIELNRDLCVWRWRVFTPWHWIKTLARDYTGRAAEGIL